jgi:hypothetical protein
VSDNDASEPVAQASGDTFHQVYGPVLPAGATDGDAQVAAIVRAEAGNPLQEEVFQVRI